MRLAAAITRAMSILSSRTSTDSDMTLVSQMEEMRLELAAVRRDNERLRLQLNSLKRRLVVTEVSGPDPVEMSATSESLDPVTCPPSQMMPSTSSSGGCLKQQQEKLPLQEQQQQHQRQQLQQQLRQQQQPQQEKQRLQQLQQQQQEQERQRRQQRRQRRRHPSLLPSVDNTAIDTRTNAGGTS